jgi:hypothetical protein
MDKLRELRQPAALLVAGGLAGAAITAGVFLATGDGSGRTATRKPAVISLGSTHEAPAPTAAKTRRQPMPGLRVMLVTAGRCPPYGWGTGTYCKVWLNRNETAQFINDDRYAEWTILQFRMGFTPILGQSAVLRVQAQAAARAYAALGQCLGLKNVSGDLVNLYTWGWSGTGC